MRRTIVAGAQQITNSANSKAKRDHIKKIMEEIHQAGMDLGEAEQHEVHEAEHRNHIMFDNLQALMLEHQKTQLEQQKSQAMLTR